MSGTLAGYSCVYCGAWVGPSAAHWCEKMHPNWRPQWEATRLDLSAPGGPLDRIADALQRIADALESNQDTRDS